MIARCHLRLAALAVAGLSMGVQGSLAPRVTSAQSQGSWTRPGWRLVWHDEFDGVSIGSDWTFDRGTGNGGWGNGELQSYTDRPDNARVSGGHLTIIARKELYESSNYTSARLKTERRAAFIYGRIEARIQVPSGRGLWPAFWALGHNFEEVGWPRCGEIDLMEHIGREPTRIHGTIHGPGYSGAAGVGAFFELPSGRPFADAFHVFAIEWDATGIRWFVDDRVFKTIRPADVPGPWIFSRPVFLILNLAVGGHWPGPPDERTLFPRSMRVDYVRVYKK